MSLSSFLFERHQAIRHHMHERFSTWRAAYRRKTENARPLCEALESRQLMSATATFNTNPLPAYMTDTGNGPVAMVTADFNGDGKADVVTANSLGNSISVLLGNGGGRFHSAVNYAVDTLPCDVAVGDFNGDGKLDLVTANTNGQSVSILLGNGDGTFQTRTDYDVAGAPSSIAVGDLHDDGKQDVIVICSDSNAMTIFSGSGDGTFQSGQEAMVGFVGGDVALADFNKDGSIDIALTRTGAGSIRILLNLNDGDPASFTSADYASGISPSSLLVGDFNGDGWDDLGAANPGTISMLLNNHDGTFGAASSYAVDADPGAMAAGDFNGDSFLDLAVGSLTTSQINIFTGSVTGALTPGTALEYDRVGFSALVMNDFNGDDIADLVVASSNASEIQMYIGQGDATFVQPTLAAYPVNASPTGVITANLNNDNRVDAVVYNAAAGTITVMLGDRSGRLLVGRDYAVGSLLSSIIAKDFTGDGFADLAITCANDGVVRILLNQGDGTFALGSEFNTGGSAASLVTGDFNRDGRADLAWLVAGTGKLGVVLGVGNGTFLTRTDITAGNNPVDLDVADINGDGKADLVVTNAGSNTISLMLGNGKGGFIAGRQYLVSAPPSATELGDFNGDGKTDLVVCSPSTGTLRIMLGNGNGTFRSFAEYRTDATINTISVADLNRDGKDDIAMGTADDGLLIRRGRGDGTFEDANTYSVGSDLIGLAATELVNGGTDMLVLSSSANTLRILSNSTTIPTLLHPVDADSPYQYLDADGDLVTIKLTGPGTLTVERPDVVLSDATALTLSGTTDKTTLTITVKRGRSSDGVTAITDIHLANCQLQSLAASAVDIGNITGTGNCYIKAITVRDVTANGIELAGGLFGLTVQITARRVLGAANIILGAAISSATFADFGTGTLQAIFIGTLTTKGIRNISNGDFLGSVSLLGFNPNAKTLNTATIAGDLGGALSASAWTINVGNIGTISAGKISDQWDLKVNSGSVAKIAVKTNMSGSVSTLRVGTITVGGDLTSADLTLGNAASTNGTEVLTSLTVGNNMVGSTIRAAGGLGAITTKLMQTSKIYAGYTGDAQPADAADFASGETIRSIKVTGDVKLHSTDSFSGNNIVARNITSLVAMYPDDAPASSITAVTIGLLSGKVKLANVLTPFSFRTLKFTSPAVAVDGLTVKLIDPAD